jgi:hypothetical protein
VDPPEPEREERHGDDEKEEERERRRLADSAAFGPMGRSSWNPSSLSTAGWLGLGHGPVEPPTGRIKVADPRVISAGRPFVGRMSDGLAGTASVGSRHRRTSLGVGAFAALAVFALLASAAGTGVLAGVGAVSLAPGSTASTDTSSPHGLAALSGSDLASLVASHFPNYRALASDAPSSFWTHAVAQIRAELAAPKAALSTSARLYADAGLSTGTDIVAGGGAVAALLCFVGGAETLGVACLAGIAVLGVALLIAYFLGTNDAAAIDATAAFNAARLMAYDLVNVLKTQSDGVGTNLASMNLTLNALGYEAAAAALDQLGNTSFDQYSDLAQSGIADQMASIVWGDQFEIEQAVATTAANFNNVEGASDTLGVSCALWSYPSWSGNGTAAGSFFAPGIGSTCPTTTPGTVTYDYGAILGGLPYTPGGVVHTMDSASGCPAVYLKAGTTYTAYYADTNASLSIELIPTTGGTHFNLTVVNHQTSNASYPSGFVSRDYYVCSPNGTGHAPTFVPSYSMPLNYPALGSLGADNANSSSPGFFYYLAGTKSTTAAPGTMIGLSAPGVTEPILGVGVSSGHPLINVNLRAAFVNATHPSGPQGTLVGDLFNLENASVKVGQTYWSFLRGLGYTSISEVPTNCIVPSPSNALPPGTTPGNLAGANVTQLLQIYQAYLLGLGRAFNASSGLTISNFCGHKVTFNWLNATLPFGTYAYGYVYVPGATHTSSGVGTQSWTTPSTWNLSGQIYVGPALSSMAIGLNHSWALPRGNPSTLYVEPFTNHTSSNYVVNTAGPTACLTNAAASGCNLTGYGLSISAFVTGNSSSNPNGSVAPGAGITSAAGQNVSVFLTACYQANGSSTFGNPTFHVVPTTCKFGVSRIGPTITNVSCNGVISAGCSGGGGILVASTTCGITGTIGELLAPITSLTGSSSLGCLVAEVILVALALVILAVVVAIVSRAFGRRSSS